GGHGPAARAQGDRTARLGAFDLLAIDAAVGGAPVLHPRDVRHGGLEDPDRAPGHVAPPAAADQVGAQAQPRSLGRDRAVAAQAPIWFAHAGAEEDFTRRRVEHEVRIIRSALVEVLDLPPFLPAVRAAHLQHRPGAAGDDGPLLEGEALAGHSLRDAEQLLLDQLRMHRLGGAADGEGGYPLDGGRGAVARLVGHLLGDPRPQPAGPLLVDHRDAVAFGQMEDHVTVPVQAAGLVVVDLAGDPAVAVPG